MTQSNTIASREYNGVTIPVAGTYELDANHKRVGFSVRHLMVSKVRGEFGQAWKGRTSGDAPERRSPPVLCAPGGLPPWRG